MWDVKACIVCFSTECILYKIDNGALKQAYIVVSGLKASDMDGMPKYLCVECTAHVKRFQEFRDKCIRANYAMKELLNTNKQITLVTLEAINRRCLNIEPSRSYLDLNRTHYETFQFKCEKWYRGSITSITPEDVIPVFQCSTLELDGFEVPRKRMRLLNLIKEEVEESSKEFDVQNKESTSIVNNNENYFDNDNSNDDYETDNYICKEEDAKNNVDGENLDEEYATMIPISMKEAEAVCEVYKLFRKGKFVCDICQKAFSNQKLHEGHLRRHDQHVSGNFLCVLCKVYHKTEFLLKSHMTEKHLYKYICKKCPEVSYDRMSAKNHYIWTHLQKGGKTNANWYDVRPSWLRKSGGKRVKGVVALRPVRKINKLPSDFPAYTPVPQEEQYQLVEDRKKTRNYLEAMFKCQLCYKGFRESTTYGKHMRKHDPQVSGPLQCDMCKLHFRTTRNVYKHMIISHLFKYSCQVCNFVCFNKGQAHMHYRWHKNVTYSCPHCEKEFKKASTRLTHIRIKHPSTIVCNICGHSFVSENGLYCHKKLAHSKEEIEQTGQVEVDPSDPQYCAECDVQFVSPAAYKTHLGSSNRHAQVNLSIKPVRAPRAGGTGARARGGGGAGGGGGQRARNGSSEIVNTGVPTATNCEICNQFLSNDVQARRHYEAEHPGADFLKRYMCDVCGHTTRVSALSLTARRHYEAEHPGADFLKRYMCDVCGHTTRVSALSLTARRHYEAEHPGADFLKRYMCDVCGHTTRVSALSLTARRHYEAEHPCADFLKRYMCDVCGHTTRVSALSLTARRHYEAEHPGADFLKRYMCDVCGHTTRVSALSLSARRHYEAEHPGADFLKRYMCDVCGHTTRVSALSLTARRHYEAEHPGADFLKRYMCDVCGHTTRVSALSLTARRHYEAEHPGADFLKRYMCDVCGHTTRVSALSLTARRHYEAEHPGADFLKRYMCDVCGHTTRVSALSLSARRHYEAEHPGADFLKRYMCDVCGHTTRVSALSLTARRHYEAEHPGADFLKRYMCDVCGHTTRVSALSLSARRHYEAEHPGADFLKRYMCDVCGHTTRVSALSLTARRHYEAEHPGADFLKRYMCDVCGHTTRVSALSLSARRHYEAEHPGADFLKRYMCDVCGHTTRQYANLMVHMRTHTQEKPYGCPHCDRRFSMPSNRDRHLVVHTGEKKYQCQHCSRRFTQSSAVKLHIQTVHLKIPYAPWDKKNRKRRKEMEGGPLVSVAPPAPLAAPAPAPPAPHKLLLEHQGDYLNAYITYNE